MNAFLLVVVATLFFLGAFFADKTGSLHLLSYGIICMVGAIIIQEINNKK